MSLHHGDPPVMEADRQLSVHVSRALDCLGKNQEMVKFRVDWYKRLEQDNTNESNGSEECIVSGSKGEGLTAVCESDVDYMCVYNDVICGDDTSPLRHVTDVTVLKADRQDTSSGYTKLRLCRFEGKKTQSLIQDSLVEDENRQLYLSSDCFIESYKKKVRSKFAQCLGRSGPSQQQIAGLFFKDNVAAFRCICPQITHSFITRHRDYGWPSNDQLAKIATLDSHVVPVGYKGSDTACLEWRICYTKAERFLMSSLNDTQTKLYILLKMVAKTYFNSISKEITSYVLKNIVLWLAEYCDIETLNEELLVDKLMQALGFLRKCIINNNLPSYMIPERNLFSEKLDKVQRQKLVILLTELMNEGGGLLKNCEKLYVTMVVLYYEPAVAEQYRWKRDMIEKLWLWLNNKFHENMSYCEGDSRQAALLMFTDEDSGQYVNLVVTLRCLILPDSLSLLQQEHDFPSILSIGMQRFKQWLS